MMAPAVAVNVAVVLPAATVTEGGTARAWLSTDSETLAPPAAAALERVTVQVLVAPEGRVVGEQTSEESVAVATREREAVLDTPPKEAVTVAV